MQQWLRERGQPVPEPDSLGTMAGMPGMEHGAHEGHMAMSAMYGPYPMTREASGTSWQPDRAMHRGIQQAGKFVSEKDRPDHGAFEFDHPGAVDPDVVGHEPFDFGVVIAEIPAIGVLAREASELGLVLRTK